MGGEGGGGVGGLEGDWKKSQKNWYPENVPE